MAESSLGVVTEEQVLAALAYGFRRGWITLPMVTKPDASEHLTALYAFRRLALEQMPSEDSHV